MKRFFLMLALLAPMLHAQNIRYDNNLTQAASNVPAGAAAPVYTVPFGRVYVCAYPASGNPCSNQVTVYSDEAGTSAIQQPILADGSGRYGFWIPPGQYSYSIQRQNGANVGTYPLTLTSPQGPAGPAIPFIGTWSSTYTYALGDGVTYDGQFYISLASGNIAHEPDTSGAYWSTITIPSQTSFTLSVIAYGAIGNGTHDDTSSIQAAIDAAYALGGANVFIPSGTYRLTSALTGRSGVTIIGTAPKLEYYTPMSPPDDHMIPDGGSWLDCSGVTTCISGNQLRNFNLYHLGFEGWSGSAIAFGGNSVDGISFSHWQDLIFIGSTTVGGSNIGLELNNFQHLVTVGIQMYGMNTCFRMTNWTATYNGGNSDFFATYCNVYARSVANGTSTVPSAQLVVLAPTTGSPGGLNDIHFVGLQINESVQGSGLPDGTGTTFSSVGLAANGITGTTISGGDFENFAPGNLRAFYFEYSTGFNGQFSYFYDFATRMVNGTGSGHNSLEVPGIGEVGKSTFMLNDNGWGWEAPSGNQANFYMGSDGTLSLSIPDSTGASKKVFDVASDQDGKPLLIYRQISLNDSYDTVPVLIGMDQDVSTLQPINVLAPNITAGHKIEMDLTQSATPGDGMGVGFDYEGEASTTSNAFLGVSAQVPLRVFPDGSVNWNGGTKISSSSQVVAYVTAPSSSTASCTAGQQAYDTSYLYVCVAGNTWKRTALSSW